MPRRSSGHLCSWGTGATTSVVLVPKSTDVPKLADRLKHRALCEWRWPSGVRPFIMSDIREQPPEDNEQYEPLDEALDEKDITGEGPGPEGQRDLDSGADR